MKNFPHQISELGRLTDALRVFDKCSPKVLAHDPELGEQLARALVYTFRNKNISLEEALRLERKKKPANQGTSTAARELRKFFLLLGFLQTDKFGVISVSAAGKKVLASEGERRLALWRDALEKLELRDSAGNISNPYKILLRLVGDTPGVESGKLFLALEARDNSEAEYKRISKDIGKSPGVIAESLGLSDASVKNALKILPSLALQLGAIKKDGSRVFLSTVPVIVNEDEISFDEVDGQKLTKLAASHTKKVNADQIAPQPNNLQGDDSEAFVDLAEANKTRKKRLIRHQFSVTQIAKLFAAHGYELYVGVFDCVAIRPDGDKAFLVEVKTLDKSAADEIKQLIKGVGQLFKYEYFDLPMETKGRKCVKVFAFDSCPSDATISFLGAIGIHTVWLDANDAWHIAGGGLFSDVL